MLADAEAVKAQFGYTPTFVPRTNVQGDYGDDTQAFWLTWTQRDWSLGEQVKYYRDELSSRYWEGTGIDVRVPGQLTLQLTSTNSAVATAVEVVCPYINEAVAGASITNLFTFDSPSSSTDQGAHGLGTTPNCIVFDGDDIYMSSSSSGVGVRKWDGAVFSTFSATPSDELAFLNNTLYGIRRDGSGTLLRRYDTAGVATTLYTWLDAAGGVGRDGTSKTNARMVPWGGKLLILWTGLAGRCTLYVYDGTGVATLAEFPNTFYGWDVTVADGSVFVSGSTANYKGSLYVRPTVYFYNNGQFGLLWESSDEVSAASIDGFGNTAVAPFRNGIVFNDDTDGEFMFYDPRRGGVSSIGSYTVTGSVVRFAAGSIGQFFINSRATTTPYRFPSSGSAATSGSYTSSLIDFNSSLDKIFRGITVDFVAGTDGDGGSVDIAYRVGDVDGAYTTLQTGATSGTEYTLTNITGKAISVKITLNKGTSTSGPVLKRVFGRAVPLLNNYERGALLLNCTGKDGSEHILLRDGKTPHPKDGLTMATDLRTAATSATPISLTDVFGTRTVVVDEGFDIRAVRPQEFIVAFPYREV